VTIVSIDDKELHLTNLEKVLYPRTGFTKGQVINYYVQMAHFILPHISGKPITLKRYPEGVDKDFFYEKQCPSHRPHWLSTAPVYSRHNEDVVNYCLIDSVAALVWLANLASIEIHPNLAMAKDVTRPTSMVFDLDPTEPADLHDCADVALMLRDMFEHLSLRSFIKTSGGKGMHLYVPLNTPVTYDQTKSFSNAIANLLERQDPKRITANMRKDLRPGKVFVDWSQNDQHKTTVAVYSLRAREMPTVSTPLQWKELEEVHRTGHIEKLIFQAPDVIKRVEKLGDIFAPVLKIKQHLPSLNKKSLS